MYCSGISLSLLTSMLQSTQHLPQTPVAATHSQRPIQTQRAPYGPPAICEWVQSQHPQPARQEIAAERHQRRYDIRKDQQEYPPPTSMHFLHPHFCLNVEDRNLAFDEGMNDIRDAVSAHKPYSDFVDADIG